MGKETDKTGYDFHSGCLRNQSMYAVIARSSSVLGAISHFFSDTGVVHVGAGPVMKEEKRRHETAARFFPVIEFSGRSVPGL